MSRGAKFGIGVGAAVGVVVILLGTARVTGTLQTYRLPSESMEPTYLVGTRLIAGRNGFPFSKPGRGDVIIAYGSAGATHTAEIECAAERPGAPCGRATPGRSDVKFVKRIVALGGDRVSIRGGRAVVNGKPLDEPYARLDPACESCNLPREITVPPGHVFAMGDNRGSANDDRDTGPTPEDWIVGKVLFKYWG